MIDYIDRLSLSWGDIVSVELINDQTITCIFVGHERYEQNPCNFKSYMFIWDNSLIRLDRHYTAKLLLRFNHTICLTT